LSWSRDPEVLPRAPVELATRGKVTEEEGLPSRGNEGNARLETRKRIRLLVAVAARNGSSISSEELHALLPTGLFESTRLLERFIKEDQELRSELILVDGEVAPRGAASLAASRNQLRTLTETRVNLARSFASSLSRVCPHLMLIAISGSTAYGGAKARDDIDFFLVTKQNRLWISLLIALLAAKMSRMRDPNSPVFCFNRATEFAPCVEAFSKSSDPLMAREALNLRVLTGEGTFQQLLRVSRWMERFFPRLYNGRLDPRTPEPALPDRRPAPHWFLANLAAFVILAPYLWIVGLIRNARLTSEGKVRARFRTVIRPRFCAYESTKYEDLRNAYRAVF